MCLQPFTKKIPPNANSSNWRVIEIPCGKCIQCKAKYQNSIMIRIVEELKCWSKASFLTFTYSDANLPQIVNSQTGETHGTLVKSHFQTAIRLFRQSFKRKHNKPPKFKYFLCGEYGPRTFRPHAHCIFFGLDRKDLCFLVDYWTENYGFVDYERIDLSSIKSLSNTGRYLGKYASKGVYENPLVELGLVSPTFRLMSKGLGLEYVNKNSTYHKSGSIEQIADKFKYRINNCNYALPRYYKTKIFGEKSRLQYKITNTLLARSDEDYNRQFRALQKSSSDTSPANTIHFQEIDANRYRAAETAERYEKFLNKSKI